MKHENWFNDSEENDMMLSSVEDADIKELPDSYDDPRIDTLVWAYLNLRASVWSRQ